MEPPQNAILEEEQELLYKIGGGKTDLFEKIIRKYNSYLYRVGRSYGFNHAETEDLMQNTYINTYLNLHQFEHRSSFKTWIVRIMYNECFHYWKKTRSKMEVASEDNTDGASGAMFRSGNDQTQTTVENNELRGILEEAIGQIPEAYRMVFTLRELNGMSVKETAEAMDLTESNVKVRFNRAKNMLKEVISISYKPQEIFEFILIYCDGMVERVMERIHQIETEKHQA